ncbi:thioredoxin-like protein, partial [Armillaria fumosa]
VEQLQIGSSLAGLSITLPNQNREDVEIGTIASERGVVLFLVPRDDTPSTQQACAYRGAYDKFTEAGYDVYCLSADEPGKQGKWKDKKSLPYNLLFDPKRTFISALGAGTTKTSRSHFVFAKGGVMIDKRTPVKPVDRFGMFDFIQEYFLINMRYLVSNWPRKLTKKSQQRTKRAIRTRRIKRMKETTKHSFRYYFGVSIFLVFSIFVLSNQICICPTEREM